jgi:hypothetical protein
VRKRAHYLIAGLLRGYPEFCTPTLGSQADLFMEEKKSSP